MIKFKKINHKIFIKTLKFPFDLEILHLRLTDPTPIIPIERRYYHFRFLRNFILQE